jgi:hypothetical protein
MPIQTGSRTAVKGAYEGPLIILRRNVIKAKATYLSLLALLWGVSWLFYCQQAVVVVFVDRRTSSSSSLSSYVPSPEERARISLPLLSTKRDSVDLVTVKSNTNYTTTTIPTATDASNNLWENNPALPVWMKEYFDWHHEQLSHLNETNWKSQRYLVMRCLKEDLKCGGAADRLSLVPVAVLLAKQSARILFIKWERPCALTEFLIPPAGGLDWRIPAWLDQRFDFAKRPYIMTLHHAHEQLSGTGTAPDKMLADMLCQINDAGAAYYQNHTSAMLSSFDVGGNNDTNNLVALEDVFRHVWHVMFQPSIAVAALIHQHFKQTGLIPGAYTAVHIRSQYLRDKSGKKHNRHFRNAVNCASELAPGLPILISSDSESVAEYARQYGQQAAAAVALKQKEKGATAVAVVARPPSNSTPLHLDRGRDYLAAEVTLASIEEEGQRRPSDYYDVFVDLYLLANSRCIALHTGGFGRWARLVSDTAVKCWINHGTKKCQWTTTTNNKSSNNNNSTIV